MPVCTPRDASCAASASRSRPASSVTRIVYWWNTCRHPGGTIGVTRPAMPASPAVSRAAFACRARSSCRAAPAAAVAIAACTSVKRKFVPDELVLVAGAHAVVAQQAQPVRDVVVVGGDHAAFAGRDVLRRVEREGRHPEAADAPAVDGRAVSLGRVLDDRGTVPPGDRRDRRHVGRLAVEVHRHHDPRRVGAHRRPTTPGRR